MKLKQYHLIKDYLDICFHLMLLFFFNIKNNIININFNIENNLNFIHCTYFVK